MRRRTLIVAALAGALTACSSAPAPSPTQGPPPASVAVPTDGVSLADLGLKHAPVGFSVPKETRIVHRVDQPNVVTVVASEPGAERFASYLRTNLPAMGFEITADSEGALLFTNGTIQGAFTGGDATQGITLRML